jgi:hypothetical protein
MIRNPYLIAAFEGVLTAVLAASCCAGLMFLSELC